MRSRTVNCAQQIPNALRHYCGVCGWHFGTEAALRTHKKTEHESKQVSTRQRSEELEVMGWR